MRGVLAAFADGAGEQSRLDERQLAVTDFPLEERMGDLLDLALLVSGDGRLARLIREFDGAAIAGCEVVGFQLASVEQRDGEAFDPGAEFFHEIEGEGFAAGAMGVEVTDERIEADRISVFSDP